MLLQNECDTTNFRFIDLFPFQVRFFRANQNEYRYETYAMDILAKDKNNEVNN